MLGVEPVFINSNLVSAQNRQRYYWCNWKVEQPEDKGIELYQVLESNPENVTEMSEAFIKRQAGRRCLRTDLTGKASSLSSMEYVKNGRQGDYIVIRPAAIVGRKIRGDGKRDDYSELPITQILEVGDGDKARCVSTVQKDTLYSDLEPGRYVASENATRYRKFTPIECERLQTLPDDYTKGVSNTQRYRMIGNGWTVDVIAHIFRQI